MTKARLISAVPRHFTSSLVQPYRLFSKVTSCPTTCVSLLSLSYSLKNFGNGKQASHAGIEDRFRQKCIHTSLESLCPVSLLLVRGKTADKWLWYFWSFSSEEIANIDRGLISIAKRHLKVHHDQLVSALMLLKIFLDFFKRHVPIRGCIGVNTILLKQGCHRIQVVEIIVYN